MDVQDQRNAPKVNGSPWVPYQHKQKGELTERKSIQSGKEGAQLGCFPERGPGPAKKQNFLVGNLYLLVKILKLPILPTQKSSN